MSWTSFVALGEKEWVVYAKARSADLTTCFEYLARYTHCVAVSNHRLIAFDGQSVTFRWKDYAHGNKKRIMTVRALSKVQPRVIIVIPALVQAALPPDKS